MKKIISFLILLFLNLFIFNLSGQNNLKFTGTITHRDTEKPLEKTKIEVFNRNKLIINTVFTNDSGMYSFEIPLETPDNYTVKVSRSGLASKLFEINSENIPKKALERKFPEVYADLALSEIVPNVDYAILNKPLNRYYYDPERDNYTYDKDLLEKTLTNLSALKLTEEKAKKGNETALKKQLIDKQQAVVKQKRTRLYLFIGVPCLLLLLFFIYRIFKKKKIKTGAKYNP